MATDKLQRVIDGLSPVNHWDGSFVLTDIIDLVGGANGASSAATSQLTTGADHRQLPAIEFDGSINGMDVSNAVGIFVGETALSFSIMFSLANTTSNKAFFSRYVDSTNYARLYYDSSDNKLHFKMRAGSVTTFGIEVDNFDTLYTSGESVLTISMDFAAGTRTVTLDGKEIAYSVHNAWPAAAPSLSGGTEFGYMVSGEFGSDVGFEGVLDEILFFDKKLTLEEHFNLFAGCYNARRILSIGDEQNIFGGDSRGSSEADSSFIYKPDTFPATTRDLKHIEDSVSGPYPEVSLKLAARLQPSQEAVVLISGAVDNSTLMGSAVTSWNYRNPNDHFDRSTVYGEAVSLVNDLYDRVDAVMIHVGINDALNDYRDEDTYLSALETLHERLEEDLGYKIDLFVDYIDKVTTGSTDESCQAIRKAQLRFINPAKRRHLCKGTGYLQDDGIHFAQGGQDSRGDYLGRVMLRVWGVPGYELYYTPLLHANRESGTTRYLKLINPVNKELDYVKSDFLEGRVGDGSWEEALSAQYIDDRLIKLEFTNSVTELRGPFYGANPPNIYTVRMAGTGTGYATMGNILMVDDVISRPADYPMFSAFDKLDPGGQYNVDTIPQALEEYGFTKEQKPPRQYFNKLFRDYYHWIRYLDLLAVMVDESQYIAAQFNVLNGTSGLTLKYRRIFDSIFLRLSIPEGSISGSAFELVPIGNWPSDMIPNSNTFLRCSVINNGLKKIGLLKIPTNASSNMVLSWLDTSIAESSDQFNTTFDTTVGILPERLSYYI